MKLSLTTIFALMPFLLLSMNEEEADAFDDYSIEEEDAFLRDDGIGGSDPIVPGSRQYYETMLPQVLTKLDSIPTLENVTPRQLKTWQDILTTSYRRFRTPQNMVPISKALNRIQAELERRGVK